MFITTGVCMSRDCEGLFDDFNYIDLGCEECKEEHSECGYDEDSCEYDMECEGCSLKEPQGCDCCDTSENTKLYGAWLKDEEGKYYPDPNGEWACVMRELYVQVVHSKYAKKCRECSPCFPNQVDLNSNGDYWGYSLPEEMMSEYWLNEHKGEIVETKEVA